MRPHLEFSTPAWSPWLVSDIEALEKVQRKAVNMVTGIKGKTYTEKCLELDLDPLMVRRKIADLIQVYKYIHNEDQMAANKLFVRVAARGRETRQSSDPLNLRVPRTRLEVRKHSFPVRVVQYWNDLDPEVKNMPTLHQFKQAIKLIYRRTVVGTAAE